MFEAGSITGGTITLAVACVGVGTVAFPLAFAEAGIFLSACLLLFIGTFTILSIRHLAFGVEVLRLGSYEDMSRVLLGKRYEEAVRVMLLFLNFGVCVGYIVVIAEMIEVITPQIQSGLLYMASSSECISDSTTTTSHSSSTASSLNIVQRWVVGAACSSNLSAISLVVFWVLVLFPLSLAQSMDSMRFASSMAILSTCFIMACVVYRYFVPFVRTTNNSNHIHQPSGRDEHAQEPVDVPLAKFNFMTLLALPIMMYSLDCQCFVFQIYNDLNPSNGNRSMWGITTVAFRSTIIACIFFFGVGAFGALSFGDKTKGNILQNYDPLHDPLFGVGYIMYSFPVIMAFVFTLFPCRDAVFNAVYGLNATNIEITSTAPTSPNTSSPTTNPPTMQTSTAPCSPNTPSSSSKNTPTTISKENDCVTNRSAILGASGAAASMEITSFGDDGHGCSGDSTPATTTSSCAPSSSLGGRRRRKSQGGGGGNTKMVTFAASGHLLPPAHLSPDMVPVYPSYHHSTSNSTSNSSFLPSFPQVVLPHAVMGGVSPHAGAATTTGSDVSSLLGSHPHIHHHQGDHNDDGEEEDEEVDEPATIIIDTGAFYMTPMTFYLWSTLLSFSAMVVAVLTPGIVVVIGLLGAMCSSTLCFTYPALFRLAMDAHDLVPFYRSSSSPKNSSVGDEEEMHHGDRSGLLSGAPAGIPSSYGSTDAPPSSRTESNTQDDDSSAPPSANSAAIQVEKKGGPFSNPPASREEELAVLKADSNCGLAGEWWVAERAAHGDCYFYIRHERVLTYIMLWLGIVACVLGTSVATFKVVIGDA
jgi:sodium-coupled neutral amino acid transporter 7/8